jgi:hypothetical protein
MKKDISLKLEIKFVEIDPSTESIISSPLMSPSKKLV